MKKYACKDPDGKIDYFYRASDFQKFLYELHEEAKAQEEDASESGDWMSAYGFQIIAGKFKKLAEKMNEQHTSTD